MRFEPRTFLSQDKNLKLNFLFFIHNTDHNTKQNP